MHGEKDACYGRLIAGLANIHGKHTASTDVGREYPQDCRFLNLKHQIHSLYEKSIVEDGVVNKGQDQNL